MCLYATSQESNAGGSNMATNLRGKSHPLGLETVSHPYFSLVLPVPVFTPHAAASQAHFLTSRQTNSSLQFVIGEDILFQPPAGSFCSISTADTKQTVNVMSYNGLPVQSQTGLVRVADSLLAHLKEREGSCF